VSDQKSFPTDSKYADFHVTATAASSLRNAYITDGRTWLRGLGQARGIPMGKRTATAALVLLASLAWAQQQAIDLQLASQYFAEMKAASGRDAGHLWGHQLYGPMLFVDPDTRFAVANRQDTERKLTARGDLFTGTVPEELGAANTAVKWAGVEWTMVMWPLPEYRRDRISRMAHECFHRIQPQLGFQAMGEGDVPNSQLDTRDGRIWLQLELRALERALWANGSGRRQAIADALYFRGYRRSLFSDSGTRENALEMNEGLAEYTGVTVAAQSPGEVMSEAEVTLHLAPYRGSFVRSFAYVTGPAYGYLLDQRGQSWRSRLQTGSDLAELVRTSYQLPPLTVNQAEAMRRAQDYDGDDIIALENERDLHQKKAIADAKARYVDGPVLILPLSPGVRYTFEPNNVVALDANSAVYLATQITDEWGVLRAEKGALLLRDKDGQLLRAQVPAPANANSLQGDGWILDLRPDWQIKKGTRAGDFTVLRH